MIIKLTDFYNGNEIEIKFEKIKIFGSSESLGPVVLTKDGEVLATVSETFDEIKKIISKSAYTAKTNINKVLL